MTVKYEHVVHRVATAGESMTDYPLSLVLGVELLVAAIAMLPKGSEIDKTVLRKCDDTPTERNTRDTPNLY